MDNGGIAVLGVAIALFSACVSAVATYRTIKNDYEKRRLADTDRLIASAKKEYAAERDFNHLRNHFQQLQENMNVLSKEHDLVIAGLSQEVRRLDTSLRVLLAKVEGKRVQSVIDEEIKG